jgi:hypothetical protein
MLGEAGAGPEGPDFVGDLTGRRGPCRRSWASRDDSSGRDVPHREAEILGVST